MARETTRERDDGTADDGFAMRFDELEKFCGRFTAETIDSIYGKERDIAEEARVNAEDPSNGFSPCPGRVAAYHVPGGRGVRVDTHVFAGYDVPPYYDSLLAKLITTGQTREEAIQVMRRALDEFTVEPLRTTIPLHKQIFSDPTFWRGQITTDYLDRLLGEKE